MYRKVIKIKLDLVNSKSLVNPSGDLISKSSIKFAVSFHFCFATVYYNADVKLAKIHITYIT